MYRVYYHNSAVLHKIRKNHRNKTYEDAMISLLEARKYYLKYNQFVQLLIIKYPECKIVYMDFLNE